MLEAKKLQLETEGVTVRDSEFNSGAGPFSTRQALRGGHSGATPFGLSDLGEFFPVLIHPVREKTAST